MGQHRYNPVAQANSGPQQTVNVLDLGEDVALLGVMLRPVVDTVTNELVIRLEMVGGHASPILGGFAPKPVGIGELARLPLAQVRAVLKWAAPSAAETPGGLAPVGTPEDGAAEAPRLSVLSR